MPKYGDLRITRMTNFNRNVFRFQVETPEQGLACLEELANFDLAHPHVSCGISSLEVYEPTAEDKDCYEWCEWTDELGYEIDEIDFETPDTSKVKECVKKSKQHLKSKIFSGV